MSSSDDQIIQSVGSIISAVETLVEDIQVARDIDEAAKNFALSKVDSVAKDLDLINRALFQNEFPPESQEETPNVAKTVVDGGGEPSLNEMLSAWAQPSEVPAEAVDKPARDEKPKPRIIVSPVKRRAEADTAFDQQAEFDAVEDVLEPKTRDKLTLIEGIDEAVVALLGKHGVHSFQDIADFREADMMRLSSELSDPSRVSRENWIEQAALLQQGVMTKYAHLVTDESGFDRLFYIDAYTSHPVSTAFEPSEWAVAKPGSSLSDRLSDVEGGVFEEPASIEQADEFDGLEESEREEVLAPLGFVPHAKKEQSFDENFAHKEKPHDNLMPDDASEMADIYEPAEPGDLENQEFSRERLLAETEEMEQRKQDAGLTPDVQDLTNALLAKKQALEAELAALTGNMVEKAEQFEVETDVREASDLTVRHGFVETEDEASIDGLAPEVEILTHQEGHNEVSELSARYQEETFDNERATEADGHQDQRQGEPLSGDDLGDGPIWHEEVSTAKDYVPPVVNDYDDTHAHPNNGASHYAHEEQVNDHVSSAEEYHQGQGGEPFPHPQAEEYISNGQVSSYQHKMSGEEENSYVYDVNHLADHDPAAHQAHLAGFEGVLPPDEQPQGLHPDHTGLPPHQGMMARESRTEQADHMDGISRPRDGMGQRGVDFSERPLENVQFDQQHLMDPPLPPGASQQHGFREQADHRQERARPHLRPDERVSDKVPDVQDKINNGLTLGQYLAAKGGNETETVTQEDPVALYPPQQSEGEEGHELAYQDQSIRLNQQQSRVPHVNLGEAGVPPIAPHPSNLPPVPPAANGLQTMSPIPAHPLNRGDGAFMPPVPPTELGGQTMPLERGQPPLQAQSHMPQQRPGGESLEGPTPPPFTDMSGVINQGQAYADTQRIIAAKRKSDAERARNRSDIADGQAYVDTQKLLESGPPLELRQGGDRAVPPHAIPPLPREALEAANAYPRGKNNPDIQYRGQKPLEQSAEDYSSEFLQEQEKHEVHYRGHKIEAPVKDGAPQFREGVNTIDTAERGRAVENKENAPSGFKAKAQKFAASLHRSFSDKE